MFKFLQNNYNKQSKRETGDTKKKEPASSTEKVQPNATKATGILNWFNKYPEVFSQDGGTEKPAMILDEDESLKQKIREKYETKKAQTRDENSANFFSQLQHDKNYKNKEQMEEANSELNDTLALRSASQVPMNFPFNNPSYLYEEQEGSVDLRSECSFLAKNNSFLNNNLNRSKNSKTPQKANAKNINSWNEVF